MDVEWIACEAVQTGLIGWPVAAGGAVGASVLVDDLTELHAALTQAPILVCGLPGQTRMVPCTPLPGTLATTGGARIVPGLGDAQFGSQTAGAEVRIAGFLARRGGWDGVICVTGETHVWAHVSAGEVVSFQAFATGRLAAALAVSGAWDEQEFLAMLEMVVSRPERLAAALAQAAGVGGLWGALLGAEMAASRAYWLGQQVAVIGEGEGVQGLVQALQDQGVPVDRDGDLETLIAGLNAARDLEEG